MNAHHARAAMSTRHGPGLSLEGYRLMKPLNRRFPFGHEPISIPIREKSEELAVHEERTTLPPMEGASRAALPFRSIPSDAEVPKVVRRPARSRLPAPPAWFRYYAVISFLVIAIITFLVLCWIRNPFARSPSSSKGAQTTPEERR